MEQPNSFVAWSASRIRVCPNDSERGKFISSVDKEI